MKESSNERRRRMIRGGRELGYSLNGGLVSFEGTVKWCGVGRVVCGERERGVGGRG